MPLDDAGIAICRKLVLSTTNTDRILNRYLDVHLWLTIPEGLFCPFQAGDGFGFGLSSTKWIFIGADGR